MTPELENLSSALAFRLRDIARMLDRLDRLEAGTGAWLRTQHGEALAQAAREMTLRALRTVADPANFGLLAYLAAHSTAPMAELERASGLGRLVLAERINDLVQVGLAGRNIDTDQVQGTAAGAALVGLINSIGEATATKLAGVLRPVAKG